MPHSPSFELALVADAARAQGGEAHRPASTGPGWFASSWDLQRGLEVREGWSDEGRVRGCIQAFLFVQRAVGRTASPSSTTAIA
jgi:hypothetical protein